MNRNKKIVVYSFSNLSGQKKRLKRDVFKLVVLYCYGFKSITPLAIFTFPEPPSFRIPEKVALILLSELYVTFEVICGLDS